jgi:hypothetical protein
VDAKASTFSFWHDITKGFEAAKKTIL